MSDNLKSNTDKPFEGAKINRISLSAIGVVAGNYYERRKRQHQISAKRRFLRARVKHLSDKSRQSAGTRTLVEMLRDKGIVTDRFKVGRLMKELGFMSWQPVKHACKNTQIERPDIPNSPYRLFDFALPNKVRCGDTTYV